MSGCTVNKYMRKIISSFLILLVSISLTFPREICYAVVSPQIADFLCEKGTFYYNQGKYPEALIEFKKALLANPESAVAKDFIGLIEIHKPTVPIAPLPEAGLVAKISSVSSFLNKFEKMPPGKKGPGVQELQSAVVKEKKGKTPGLEKLMPGAPKQSPVPQEIVIDIDAKVEGRDLSNIDTNVGERLLMKGKNVTRFLATDPAILKAARQTSDEILVEPLEIGTSHIIFWDDDGTKTFNFNVAQRKFEEEILRSARQRYLELSRPESFKVSYSIDSDSFMTGRGVGDLKRQSIVYGYSSSIIGETPYGNFDAAVAGNRSNEGIYRVSNLRMGLTRAHYDQFKDINLRFFDFTPTFPSFGFPSIDLRGASVDAPMFNKRINYTAFWGAIPLGTFTQLESSSGLSRTKKAWLEGIGVNYRLSQFANFNSFYAHSYGPDRTAPVLTDGVTGFGMDYRIGRVNVGTAAAYDMHDSISYTANSSLTISRLRIGMSMTENNKNFKSLLGGATTSGSTGGSLSLDYRPTQNLAILNTFTGTHDKVFNNPARPTRPNYNSNTRVLLTPDAHTDVELGYIMDDQIGSVSPAVTETKELVLRKRLYFFKKLSTFLTYQNTKSKNYTSAVQDFNNNRIFGGVNLRLIGELYFYYTKEFDILRNTFTGETALPTAQEYGLNYYSRIFDTPFYTNLRLVYRDEENTQSVLSNLSGEDRLEGVAELTFKPNPDAEAFLKCRITDVWAEKAGVTKHFDVDWNWGLRFVWDTGLRWESVGGFAGFVFYDLNADGIKQAAEKGVKGVQIKAADGKVATTDDKGYYRISGVKGKRTVLEMVFQTVPRGYNATTSAQREVDIVAAKTKRVDFGIATRSEISGVVFNDKNGNGKFEAGEEAVKGVGIILDDKQRTVSTVLGEYMFRKLSPGEHTLKLDLKSLPVKFIPKVPVVKKVSVVEGATFVYNIPLAEQKIKENPKK